MYRKLQKIPTILPAKWQGCSLFLTAVLKFKFRNDDEGGFFILIDYPKPQLS